MSAGSRAHPDAKQPSERPSFFESWSDNADAIHLARTVTDSELEDNLPALHLTRLFLQARVASTADAASQEAQEAEQALQELLAKVDRAEDADLVEEAFELLQSPEWKARLNGSVQEKAKELTKVPKDPSLAFDGLSLAEKVEVVFQSIQTLQTLQSRGASASNGSPRQLFNFTPLLRELKCLTPLVLEPLAAKDFRAVAHRSEAQVDPDSHVKQETRSTEKRPPTVLGTLTALDKASSAERAAGSGLTRLTKQFMRVVLGPEMILALIRYRPDLIDTILAALVDLLAAPAAAKLSAALRRALSAFSLSAPSAWRSQSFAAEYALVRIARLSRRCALKVRDLLCARGVAPALTCLITLRLSRDVASFLEMLLSEKQAAAGSGKIPRGSAGSSPSAFHQHGKPSIWESLRGGLAQMLLEHLLEKLQRGDADIPRDVVYRTLVAVLGQQDKAKSLSADTIKFLVKMVKTDLAANGHRSERGEDVFEDVALAGTLLVTLVGQETFRGSEQLFDGVVDVFRILAARECPAAKLLLMAVVAKRWAVFERIVKTIARLPSSCALCFSRSMDGNGGGPFQRAISDVLERSQIARASLCSSVLSLRAEHLHRSGIAAIECIAHSLRWKLFAGSQEIVASDYVQRAQNWIMTYMASPNPAVRPEAHIVGILTSAEWIHGDAPSCDGEADACLFEGRLDGLIPAETSSRMQQMRKALDRFPVPAPLMPSRALERILIRSDAVGAACGTATLPEALGLIHALAVRRLRRFLTEGRTDWFVCAERSLLPVGPFLPGPADVDQSGSLPDAFRGYRHTVTRLVRLELPEVFTLRDIAAEESSEGVHGFAEDGDSGLARELLLAEARSQSPADDLGKMLNTLRTHLGDARAPGSVLQCASFVLDDVLPSCMALAAADSEATSEMKESGETLSRLSAMFCQAWMATLRATARPQKFLLATVCRLLTAPTLQRLQVAAKITGCRQSPADLAAQFAPLFPAGLPVKRCGSTELISYDQFARDGPLLLLRVHQHALQQPDLLRVVLVMLRFARELNRGELRRAAAPASGGPGEKRPFAARDKLEASPPVGPLNKRRRTSSTDGTLSTPLQKPVQPTSQERAKEAMFPSQDEMLASLQDCVLVRGMLGVALASLTVNSAEVYLMCSAPLVGEGKERWPYEATQSPPADFPTAPQNPKQSHAMRLALDFVDEVLSEQPAVLEALIEQGLQEPLQVLVCEGSKATLRMTEDLVLKLLSHPRVSPRLTMLELAARSAQCESAWLTFATGEEPGRNGAPDAAGSAKSGGTCEALVLAGMLFIRSVARMLHLEAGISVLQAAIRDAYEQALRSIAALEKLVKLRGTPGRVIRLRLNAELDALAAELEQLDLLPMISKDNVRLLNRLKRRVGQLSAKSREDHATWL